MRENSGKIWCAWCGKMTDHGSGSCRDLAKSWGYLREFPKCPRCAEDMAFCKNPFDESSFPVRCECAKCRIAGIGRDDKGAWNCVVYFEDSQMADRPNNAELMHPETKP